MIKAAQRNLISGALELRLFWFDSSLNLNQIRERIRQLIHVRRIQRQPLNNEPSFLFIYVRNICMKKRVIGYSSKIGKVKFTRVQCETMSGAHLLLYGHERPYKMTYDFWLEIRQVEAIYLPARAVHHFSDLSLRDRIITHPHKQQAQRCSS